MIKRGWVCVNLTDEDLEFGRREFGQLRNRPGFRSGNLQRDNGKRMLGFAAEAAFARLLPTLSHNLDGRRRFDFETPDGRRIELKVYPSRIGATMHAVIPRKRFEESEATVFVFGAIDPDRKPLTLVIGGWISAAGLFHHGKYVAKGDQQKSGFRHRCDGIEMSWNYLNHLNLWEV